MTSQPKRIQRQRTKGWRMPAGAVYVGRPTRWGNPYRVTWSSAFHEWWIEDPFDVGLAFASGGPWGREEALVLAVLNFKDALRPDQLPVTTADARTLLSGRDLVCWCPPDQPCHADVLLELVNGPGS